MHAALAAVVGDDLHRVRIGQRAGTVHDLDLALFGQPGEALRAPADDVGFPGANLVEVDLRLAEGDAVGGERARVVDHLGDVQQSLRRNAADVEAHAAESRVALDEHDLQAEVRGAEGSGVAAGAGAEDEEVAVVVSAGRWRWRRRPLPRPLP